MKSIADFKTHYNDLVNAWLNPNFSPQTSTNPFMAITTESWAEKPCIESMPEPYYGKIDNNSIAILNLHPSNNRRDSNYLGRNVMLSKINKNYAKYAEQFPPLTSQIHHKANTWWNNLYNHLKQIKFQATFNDRLQPFGIEICPWHSKGWGYSQRKLLIKTNKLDQEVYDWVIIPFIYSILRSNCQIGIALSNFSGEIIQKICHVNSAKEWNINNLAATWPNVSKKQDEVMFQYH